MEIISLQVNSNNTIKFRKKNRNEIWVVQSNFIFQVDIILIGYLQKGIMSTAKLIMAKPIQMIYDEFKQL